eukprot:5284161-Amphidinium_carterae.1
MSRIFRASAMRPVSPKRSLKVTWESYAKVTTTLRLPRGLPEFKLQTLTKSKLRRVKRTLPISGTAGGRLGAGACDMFQNNAADISS